MCINLGIAVVFLLTMVSSLDAAQPRWKTEWTTSENIEQLKRFATAARNANNSDIENAIRAKIQELTKKAGSGWGSSEEQKKAEEARKKAEEEARLANEKLAREEAKKAKAAKKLKDAQDAWDKQEQDAFDELGAFISSYTMPTSMFNDEGPVILLCLQSIFEYRFPEKICVSKAMLPDIQQVYDGILTCVESFPDSTEQGVINNFNTNTYFTDDQYTQAITLIATVELLKDAHKRITENKKLSKKIKYKKWLDYIKNTSTIQSLSRLSEIIIQKIMTLNAQPASSSSSKEVELYKIKVEEVFTPILKKVAANEQLKTVLEQLKDGLTNILGLSGGLQLQTAVWAGVSGPGGAGGTGGIRGPGVFGGSGMGAGEKEKEKQIKKELLGSMGDESRESLISGIVRKISSDDKKYPTIGSKEEKLGKQLKSFSMKKSDRVPLISKFRSDFLKEKARVFLLRAQANPALITAKPVVAPSGTPPPPPGGAGGPPPPPPGGPLPPPGGPPPPAGAVGKKMKAAITDDLFNKIKQAAIDSLLAIGAAQADAETAVGEALKSIYQENIDKISVWKKDSNGKDVVPKVSYDSIKKFLVMSTSATIDDIKSAITEKHSEKDLIANLLISDAEKDSYVTDLAGKILDERDKNIKSSITSTLQDYPADFAAYKTNKISQIVSKYPINNTDAINLFDQICQNKLQDRAKSLAESNFSKEVKDLVYSDEDWLDSGKQATAHNTLKTAILTKVETAIGTKKFGFDNATASSIMEPVCNSVIEDKIKEVLKEVSLKKQLKDLETETKNAAKGTTVSAILNSSSTKMGSVIATITKEDQPTLEEQGKLLARVALDWGKSQGKSKGELTNTIAEWLQKKSYLTKIPEVIVKGIENEIYASAPTVPSGAPSGPSGSFVVPTLKPSGVPASGAPTGPSAPTGGIATGSVVAAVVPTARPTGSTIKTTTTIGVEKAAVVGMVQKLEENIAKSSDSEADLFVAFMKNKQSQQVSVFNFNHWIAAELDRFAKKNDYTFTTNTGLNYEQLTALHGAIIMQASPDVIVKIVSANHKARNQQNNFGQTPLHAMLKIWDVDIANTKIPGGGNKTLVELLITPVSIKAKNSEGQTPLHLATIKALEAAIKLQQDPGSSNRQNDFNAAVEILTTLKNNGADIGIEDNNNKMPYDLLNDSVSSIQSIDAERLFGLLGT